MNTVNRKFQPKTDCWALADGSCSILTDCCCAKGAKCGHYKNWAQHLESKRKAHKRYQEIGIKKTVSAATEHG